MSASTDPRTEYRRRLQHRQTTVIGGVLAVMVVALLLGLAIWTGLLPAPYDPGFSQAEPTSIYDPQPCSAEGATTLALTDITANVYNGTDTSGLAGASADALKDAGVKISTVADWPKGSFSGDVMITTGEKGITAAYTLARAFNTDVVVQLDNTVEQGNATISVVLGDKYDPDSLLSTADISALPTGEAITAPADCVNTATQDIVSEDEAKEKDGNK